MLDLLAVPQRLQPGGSLLFRPLLRANISGPAPFGHTQMAAQRPGTLLHIGQPTVLRVMMVSLVKTVWVLPAPLLLMPNPQVELQHLPQAGRLLHPPLLRVGTFGLGPFGPILTTPQRPGTL